MPNVASQIQDAGLQTLRSLRSTTSALRAILPHTPLVFLRYGLGAIAGLIALAVAASVSFMIYHDYQATLANAERETRNLAHVLEEQITRSLSEVNLLLRDATEHVAELGGVDRLDESTLHDYLRRILARDALPQVRTFFAVSSVGRVVATTSTRIIPDLDTSDRDYFRHLQVHDDAQAFIGRPFRNRLNNRLTLSLSRRVNAANATFAGIVSAILDLNYFDQFYGALDLGANGSVLLVRTDGIVLTRLPVIETAIGKDISASLPPLQQSNPPPFGTYRIVSALNQRPLICSYRVLRNYPIMALVSFDEATVLAPWRQRAWTQSGVGAVFILVTLSLAWVLNRQVRLAAAAMQTLAQRETSLAQAQRLARLGAWEWNLAERRVHWSGQLYELLGLAPDRDMARWSTYARRIERSDRKGVLAELRNALRGGDLSCASNHRLCLPDGNLLYVHVEWRAERDGVGRLRRLFGFVQDVTECRQKRDEYEVILKTAMDGFWLTDSDGRFLDVNDAYCRMSGYSRTELLNMCIVDMEADQSVDTIAAYMQHIRRNGSSRFETRHRRQDRALIDIEVSAHFMSNPGGRFFVFLRDITKRRRTEQQLALAAQVFESSTEGIVITDAERRILTVNRAFSAITGYAAVDVIGRTPDWLGFGGQDQVFCQSVRTALAEKDHWQSEIWQRRKDGDTYPAWLTITAVRDPPGRITHYIGVGSDMTQRKQAEERIHFLAYYDALTELPNRLLLSDRTEQAIAAAQRNGTRVALLFLDLDHFKHVNDSLGHLAGDQLLQQVAGRLKGCIREADTLARLGGDEFILMLPGVETPEAAAQVAQKCCAALRPPFSLEGHEISISPSVGISLYPEDGDNFNILIKNADAAMYHAKEAGRNNYQFFTPAMNASTLSRILLENSLRRAVERNEFVLYYQPQVDLASGMIIGAEALIRWQHPGQGLMSPGAFIPIAEESGLIIPIGDWVIAEACRQNAAWQAAGLPAIPIAVNLSSLQFCRPDFLHSLMHSLRQSGLKARYLELELTESLLMRETGATIATLRRLRNLGLKLSVDDFGTGYSSLSYLKRFPLDKLKIDRSFVRDILTDPDDRAIVVAIINMAHTLNLRVIAEGVETEAHLAWLQTQGCDEIQGYYISKPLPDEDFGRLLAQRNRQPVMLD